MKGVYLKYSTEDTVENQNLVNAYNDDLRASFVQGFGEEFS
jgi:hypothetical protein